MSEARTENEKTPKNTANEKYKEWGTYASGVQEKVDSRAKLVAGRNNEVNECQRNHPRRSNHRQSQSE